ncbi:hypothetical protein GCM10011575_27340 [Microlunatus endophyticus]|uniref:Uncharacterized protein n=1 Tax=Microlunatus endophyticus TaxID=1716077 RepID=A0A917W4P9_9ACTN|nr:hypothetical protein GCM10011575_27340 [Microlunatus endophyticus]
MYAIVRNTRIRKASVAYEPIRCFVVGRGRGDAASRLRLGLDLGSDLGDLLTPTPDARRGLGMSHMQSQW